MLAFELSVLVIIFALGSLSIERNGLFSFPIANERWNEKHALTCDPITTSIFRHVCRQTYQKRLITKFDVRYFLGNFKNLNIFFAFVITNS